MRLNHAALMALDRVDHRLDQLLAEQRRMKAEVKQLGVDRVVVVLFLLDPRVLAVLDLNRVAEVPSRVRTISASSSTENCSVNWLKTRNSPGPAGFSAASSTH